MRARPPTTPSSVRHARFPGGFTLLELLVVILIIGLLTSIVGPRFLSQIGRSEVTTARAQIDAFDKALQAYLIDMGRYPATAEGLQALVVKPGGEAKWNGPYMQKKIPPDPWGKEYVYRCPGNKNPSGYDLFSAGPDRIPDTADDDWGQ